MDNLCREPEKMDEQDKSIWGGGNTVTDISEVIVRERGGKYISEYTSVVLKSYNLKIFIIQRI